MFDFAQKHRIVVGIVLALIGIPFVFFGVDWYFRGGDAAGQVAKVEGTPISGREFSEALRQRQDQLRQQMGGRADQALLDSPELRQVVLNQLVDERVMYQAAVKAGIVVTNAELQEVIAAIPAFRENNGQGAFSKALYEAALRSRGMTEAGFEALMRRDMMVARLRNSLAATTFVPGAVVDHLYRIREQEREVSQAAISPADLAAKVKVDEAEAKAYYDAHKDRFRTPEKAKVDFVILSLEGVQRQIQITPEQVKQYYEEHRAQLETPEERRARHILIAAGDKATPEQKAKAKQQAESLLAEAKKAPKSFAELAKKSSQDPGSAAEGGDLGFFARGRMVKAFDDAVFGMKVGDIVGPVQTPFGYHVIQLEEIKPAKGPTFDQVKAQVEADLRKAEAGKRFAEAAEGFSNLVYEQPDSLKPAADQYKLEIQKSGWLTREGGENPLLNNPKLLGAIFNAEALKDRRNTEAVEIGPNMIAAAHVTEHEASKERPFAEVQAEIVRTLTQEKAAKLAKEEGEAKLALLKKGDAAGLAWSPPVVVTREQRASLSPEAAQVVFAADTAKLPAYTATTAPNGSYVIYRISKVVDSQKVDAERRKTLGQQMQQITGMEYATSSLGSLRKKADVKVNPKALEKSS